MGRVGKLYCLTQIGLMQRKVPKSVYKSPVDTLAVSAGLFTFLRFIHPIIKIRTANTPCRKVESLS